MSRTTVWGRRCTRAWTASLLLSRPVLVLPTSWALTRQRLDGILDADLLAFDVLEVQPAGHDQVIGDFEEGHTANLERLPVGTRAGPTPFAPGDRSVVDRAQHVGVEVGYAGEHRSPVGAHLRAAGESAAGVGRLGAAILRVDQRGRSIDIVGVEGAHEAIDDFSHGHLHCVDRRNGSAESILALVELLRLAPGATDNARPPTCAKSTATRALSTIIRHAD